MLCHGKRQTITKFFDVTNGMLNLTQLLVGDTVSQHYLSAHSLPCKAQVLLLRNWCSIHQSSPAVSPAVHEAKSASFNSSRQKVSAWRLVLHSSPHWILNKAGHSSTVKSITAFQIAEVINNNENNLKVFQLIVSCQAPTRCA